jgi:hypothetical protein
MKVTNVHEIVRFVLSRIRLIRLRVRFVYMFYKVRQVISN